MRSLTDPLPDADSVTDGYLQWPIGQYIADYGLAHYEASMNAMIERGLQIDTSALDELSRRRCDQVGLLRELGCRRKVRDERRDVTAETDRL